MSAALCVINVRHRRKQTYVEEASVSRYSSLVARFKKKKKKKEMLPCRRVTILTYFQAVQMKELRQKTSDELTASA
ncbi:hypothetical protein DVA76_19665, partial [Acinetobacter baumannii]